MSWVKLDDGFFRHPKVIRAGRDARDLYLAAACWSNRWRTDGLIPREALPILAAEAEVAFLSDAIDGLLQADLIEESPAGYSLVTVGLCLLQPSPPVRSAMRRAWEAIAWRIRPLILARDGYTCRECGATEGELHVDHVIPIAAGGRNEEDNLQILCRPCNLRKGAR
jgi:hypothetical protein